MVYVVFAVSINGSCSFDDTDICGYQIVSGWSQIPSEYSIVFVNDECGLSVQPDKMMSTTTLAGSLTSEYLAKLHESHESKATNGKPDIGHPDIRSLFRQKVTHDANTLCDSIR